MKLASGKVQGFVSGYLAKPDAKWRAILVYGPDIRLRGQCFEFGHMIARRRLDAKLRAVEVGLVVKRLQGDGSVVVGLGSLEIAHETANRRAVVEEP